MTYQEKLARLRDKMAQHELDVYIIPNTDPHQSEYLAPYWRIMPWLTGFTGSAGTVVVNATHAGVWTDSRYFIQGEQELAGTGFDLMKLQVPHTPEYREWIKDHAPEKGRVGVDGRLFSQQGFEKLASVLGEKELALIDVGDLLEEFWEDRPPMPADSVQDFSVKYAGIDRVQKLQDIRIQMAKKGMDFTLITSLDDIAWTLNLRGTDIAFNPLFYAYLVVSQCDATLYIDQNKLSDDLKVELQEAVIHITDYHAIPEFLSKLKAGKKLSLSGTGCSHRLFKEIPKGVKVIREPSPSSHMKSLKNEVERAHIRQAMVKDGVALVKFFRWLEEKVRHGGVSEYEVGKQLEVFRGEQAGYVGPSFSPIVGYKGNGAIVHYSAKEASSATIEAEGMLLVDSGGQYLDGTTDITRTVTLGAPTTKQKRDFTLVLKGHIAVDRAVFPAGTRGNQFDVLARHPLWQHGLNYGHGTGHGVGFYLNVHEGPQSLSGSTRGGQAFEIGMLTSNEPGLYHEGEYGIRIENLILCEEKMHSETYGQFLGFETVTLFPIDQQLIDVALLDEDERNWLNTYHQQVWEKLSPQLNEEEKTWLKIQTQHLEE
ncbi:MAG: aminopeptidase P family protein [Bacteroidota bacterium]